MRLVKPNYDQNVEIADGIYWVGNCEKQNLHCNPYLIVDHNEAVLLDGGSREDFSTVMLKVMRAGVTPDQICRLVYHHYDPDLCGSIPQLEILIRNPALKLISHRDNLLFIKYYATRIPMECIEDIGNAFVFSSGRRLEFIRTPYSHSPGSFMTYDTQTKVLFSSDLFGSYHDEWSLYTQIEQECDDCDAPDICPKTNEKCHMAGMQEFHKRIMTSAAALRYAMEQVEKLDVSLIASQHGSILDSKAAINIAVKKLRQLPKVGFECFLEEERP